MYANMCVDGMNKCWRKYKSDETMKLKDKNYWKIEKQRKSKEFFTIEELKKKPLKLDTNIRIHTTHICMHI